MSAAVEFRAYRPLMPECEKLGISRNRAYRLIRDGHLETFLIGRARFVYLDSLATLPQRIQEHQASSAGR